jgi:hypothetical protein
MKPGDKVQVHTDRGYRDCIVLESKPYRTWVEWRYQFDPMPQFDPATWISPSTGGWAASQYFRPRPAGISPQNI